MRPRQRWPRPSRSSLAGIDRCCMNRPDTEVVFDPATYTAGVPYDALARLRRDSPVVWVDEIPVLGMAGPAAGLNPP
jgi:hypothetical protein